MTFLSLFAPCSTVTSRHTLWISDRRCCHWQESFGVNPAPDDEKFCHPCSNSVIPTFLLLSFSSSSFFFFPSSDSFSLLILFSSFSPSFSSSQVLLQSFVDLDLQYNLPPIPTVSGNCPSVLYLIPSLSLFGTTAPKWSRASSHTHRDAPHSVGHLWMDD
jgi:hypothetical protein